MIAVLYSGCGHVCVHDFSTGLPLTASPMRCAACTGIPHPADRVCMAAWHFQQEQA